MKYSDLSAEALFILKWLSKEDSSAYGECHGTSLDALLEAKLVRVDGQPLSDYSRVSVTDAGIALLLEAGLLERRAL